MSPWLTLVVGLVVGVVIGVVVMSIARMGKD